MGLFNFFKKKEEANKLTPEKAIELGFKMDENGMPTKNQILEDLATIKQSYIDAGEAITSEEDVYEALCASYVAVYDLDITVEQIKDILSK